MGGSWKSTPLGTHEMSYNFTIATGMKLVIFELLPQFMVVIYHYLRPHGRKRVALTATLDDHIFPAKNSKNIATTEENRPSSPHPM